jgi:Zn-dependent protease
MNKTEKTEILISWLTISIAFAILMTRPFLDVLVFTTAFPISLITVGAGFVLHELAHRSVARRFGAHAEYRAWQTGLIFAIVSAFFGFVFAAPGAVYIYGRITRKQNGIISLAGPATNIVVALAFGLLALSNISNITGLVGEMGFRINMFLALFNLIPFGPLDGGKVFVWSKAAWLAAAAIAFIGVFVVPAF